MYRQFVTLPLREFDAELLEGQHTVVFEQLLHNPGNDTSKDAVIVAKHEDLNEEGQSVHFPMFTQLFTGGKGMRIFVVLGIAGVCIVLLLYWKRKKREN